MVKKNWVILLIIGIFLIISKVVLADDLTVISSGINYLKSQQDATGKITGFGGESEWAAIAFAANAIDVSSVKNPSISLKDYLLNNPPSDSAPATDWERKILAIVAISENPTNFNSLNYLQKLEGFASNNQIGDINLLNDDIFGLLALIAGASSKLEIKQQTLDFIINHQNSDGGFSWSTVSPTNTSDSNDTAAAIQALEEAKIISLSNPNLDTAITKSKDYLLTTQKNDGGFGYDGSSDSDGSSTAWALMALNILGESSSSAALKAKNWLISNQEGDGGFHYMLGSGSDTYTSSHALIALDGKGWILNIYSPTATTSATPSASLTPTPSPTPSPSLTPTLTPIPVQSNNVVSTPILSSLPDAIPSPIPTPTPFPSLLSLIKTNAIKLTPSPASSPEVLGETITIDPQPAPTPKPSPSQQQLLINGFKDSALPVAGVIGLFTTFRFLEERRWKK
ncbi:terpene cyclase/mutase family protein [Candidatus Daviesbacteria bacterium]|nr:terpene cyclase/mutase family protein [Candidatus Daviesbacteria bacterium]